MTRTIWKILKELKGKETVQRADLHPAALIGSKCESDGKYTTENYTHATHRLNTKSQETAKEKRTTESNQSAALASCISTDMQ